MGQTRPSTAMRLLRVGTVVVALAGLVGGGAYMARQAYVRGEADAKQQAARRRAQRTAEGGRQLLAVGNLRVAGRELLSAYEQGARETPERFLLPWLSARLEYEAGVLPHDKEVNVVAYGPGGRQLLTGSKDHIVRVFERRGEGRGGQWVLRHKLAGHRDALIGGWFSGDGGRILTLAGDASCRLWDAAQGRELATLTEPSGQPWLCRFAAGTDGARVLTVAGEPAVRLWDGQTGKQVAVLAGHGGPVTVVRTSADGSRILTASGKSAFLWDGGTGARLLSLSGHSENIKDGAFGPDGSRLVTTAADGTARLWDGRTGALVAVLEGHTGTVYAASFTLAGGKAVMTIGSDGTARLWDSQTGKSLFPPIGHPRYSQILAISQDGARMVIRSEAGALELWDRILGSIRGALVVKEAGKGSDGEGGDSGAVVAFSPSGRRVVTGDDDGMVRIWDGRTGQPLVALKGHRGRILSIAWHPDNGSFATASSDGTVRLWRSGIGRYPLPVEGHSGEVTAVAWSPDGRQLLTAGRDGTARLWDSATGDLQWRLDGPRRVIDHAFFTPDGGRAVTVVTGGQGSNGRTPCVVKVWDTHDGHEVTSFGDQLDLGRVLAVSAQGDRVVTTPMMGALGGGDGEPDALLYDVHARPPKLVATLRGHTASLSAAAFSPDGGLLATAGDDRSVRIWDVKTGQALRQMDGHADGVRSIAFSPDGKRLLSGGGDRSARLYDAFSASTLHVLGGQVGAVRAVLFSPDGGRMLTVDSGDRAWLWQGQGGALLAALVKSTQKSHTAMAFSPDGTRIVSAGDELRIYDGQNGLSLISLDGSSSDRAEVMTAAAWSPDGKLLATGAQSGAVKLWDVHLESREPAAVRAELEPLLASP